MKKKQELVTDTKTPLPPPPDTTATTRAASAIGATTGDTGASSNDTTATGAATPRKNPASHLADYRWQPGVSPNPKGRPKGSRNKLGEDFLTALQEDFQAHGVAAIATVREERPHEYLKVIAGILPKELNVKTTTVEELSDDDLARGIAALQSALAAQQAGEGSGPETKH